MINSLDKCQQRTLECTTQNQKRRKLYKYSNGSFNKVECSYPMMEKGILVVIRGIEKFLTVLAPQTFSNLNLLQRILGFVKKNLLNMQA